MGDEHNWLAEVIGGNQKVGANHCSFELMMDKSLSSFFHLIKCFIVDNGNFFQNPLPDGCENRTYISKERICAAFLVFELC